MQLYALDQTKKLISAQRANRQQDYYCIECQSCVRLRAGLQRKRHFYHVQPTRSCRLHQKGPIHLQLQLHLYDLLPPQDCRLEYRLPEIGRIADVAWLSKKIVFEIQYSFITSEEVERRNQDYRKAGWQVVWILHDHLYNQVRLTAAEQALRTCPHYFTNMDREGKGCIYDQFDLVNKGLRKQRMKPLPVDLTQPQEFEKSSDSNKRLRLVFQRACQWPFFFSGDLSCLQRQKETSFYLQAAHMKEDQFYGDEALQAKKRAYQRMKSFIKHLFYPYRLLFHLWLEKACR
ncbi:competence protein CoiA [Candidatus Protochlamydia phocaeensis]|uniref:competence protein CoiA n=1 Tax=Candidatus Protochlamydia phocaeensis TaxID=1414722 RepID=UPI000837E73E|nr:competence protein CoiA family protein [Candidatus Protochlamydia phocaeensis]